MSRSTVLDRLPSPIYRLYAMTKPGVQGSPVLANSQPKSGTHLLSSVLSSYPDIMHAGIHLKIRQYEYPDSNSYDWKRLGRHLIKVRPGQFVTAHVPATEELVSFFGDLGFKKTFIHRDPRDVVVSDVYYIMKRADHFHHHRVANVFKTFDERLEALILGWPHDEYGPALLPIGQRTERYCAWRSVPGAYACRFEDLVGSRGGGSDEKQFQVVRELGNHIGRELDDDGVKLVASRAFSTAMHTFRKGMIGDWRNHFSARHVALFKSAGQQQLLDLGYEQSADWS